MKNWRAATFTQLTALLQPVDAIRAAILVGSLANPELQPDSWSDIDLALVIDDGELDAFFPQLDWLKPIGEVYTFSQSQNPPRYTSRVVLADTRRIDFIFILESAFYDPSVWTANLFGYGFRVLFAKSDRIETLLTGALPLVQPGLNPDAEFARLANDFWFKGMLAVSKVARHDWLIAQHLALDLARDCLVIGMMLRDRDLGTNHHRHGGYGNELLEKLAFEAPQNGLDILKAIAQTAQIFDALGREWSETYSENRFTLLDWVETVKNELDADQH